MHTSDHLVLRFQSFSAFRFPPELPIPILNPDRHKRLQVSSSSSHAFQVLCHFSCIDSLVQTEASSLFFAIKALPSPQSTTHPSKERRHNKQNNSNSSSEPPYIKTSKNQTAPSPGEHGNPLHSNILLRIYPFHTREVSCSKPGFGVRNLAKYKKILSLEKNKFSDHNRNLLLFFQMQFLFQFRVAIWLLVGIGPVLNLKVALNSRYKSGLLQTTWGV